MRVEAAQPILYPAAGSDAGAAAPSVATAAEDGTFFGADGLDFHDLLQIVNPLQHIPVVGTIYRALTGDVLTPGARLAGGTLYGGPIGLVAAAVTNLVGEASGGDPERTLVAMLTGDEPPAATPTALASATGPAAANRPPTPPAGDGPQVVAAAESMPPARAPVPPATGEPPAEAKPAPRQAVAAAMPPAHPNRGYMPAHPNGRGQALPARVAGPPAETPAAGRAGDIPQLSPAAFDTLIGMLGAEKMPDGATGPATAAGDGRPAPGSKEASIALRAELQRLAQERGLLPPVVR